MAVDSRSPRPPGQLRPLSSPDGNGVPVTVHVQPGTHDWAYAMSALRYSFTFLADNWRQAAANHSTDLP
jgi:hypothetical protein